MSNEGRNFGEFRLDLAERRLVRGDVAVELSGRYLDALILLTTHPGALITKDRFMAEVWRGIPVTDEALTQAIRTLRRALGDDAARPRFIETVPKHGYRFIAAVEEGEGTVGTFPGDPGEAEAAQAWLASKSAAGRASGDQQAPGSGFRVGLPDASPADRMSPVPSEREGQSDPRGSAALREECDRDPEPVGPDLTDQSSITSQGGHSAFPRKEQEPQAEAREANYDIAASKVQRTGLTPGDLHDDTISRSDARAPVADEDSRPAWLPLAGAGLVGGAAAGLVGGIGYGLLAATNPPAGTGAISVVLVITCLCLLIGLLGGLGVGAGIATASRLSGKRLFPVMLGGAIGGLLVGGLGRLVGLDAFTLLVGSRPLAITGGSEGFLIGALAGAGAWLGQRQAGQAFEMTAAQGAGLGAVAGLLVIAGGGQMMAGSLAVLAAAHPGTPLGTLLGGGALSPELRLLTGAVEGAVFVGALTIAFALVGRRPAQGR